MNLGNINIGKRLGIGFAIVILLMVVVAAVALNGISKLNGSADLIVKDRYVKVVIANDIQDHQNNQARFLRNA